MKLAALLFALTLSFSAAARTKVVYGEDDRLDLYEVVNELHLDLARSTAAMVNNSNISTEGEIATVRGPSLKSRGICASARFAEQVTSANCSGFLVAPDLLVTAGHCVRSEFDCRTSKWVFDYAINEGIADTGSIEVPTSSIYACAEIIQQSLDRRSQDDFALIRLERQVTDRAPLTVRTHGRVESGADLVMIGHPSGLPSKVAAGAYVRDNRNPVYFIANLDAFGGNSGSAVFDAETGMVEGILVRGETDYVYDNAQGCRVPKSCTDSGCRGEDVVRITNITSLMDILTADTSEDDIIK